MWSVRMFLAVAATLATLVNADDNVVPINATKEVCVDMSLRGPDHHDAEPQSSPLPYDVAVTRVGSHLVFKINISHRAEGPTFQGFIVQARAANSIPSPWAPSPTKSSPKCRQSPVPARK